MLRSIDLLSYLSWSELNFNSGCVSENQTTGTGLKISLRFMSLTDACWIVLFQLVWPIWLFSAVEMNCSTADNWGWFGREAKWTTSILDIGCTLFFSVRLSVFSYLTSGRAETADWDLCKWSVYVLLNGSTAPCSAMQSCTEWTWPRWHAERVPPEP